MGIFAKRPWRLKIASLETHLILIERCLITQNGESELYPGVGFSRPWESTWESAKEQIFLSFSPSSEISVQTCLLPDPIRKAAQGARAFQRLELSSLKREERRHSLIKRNRIRCSKVMERPRPSRPPRWTAYPLRSVTCTTCAQAKCLRPAAKNTDA
jgi:hypothetical protein